MTPENTNLQHFTDSFNLENLIYEATCFKGLPSCIDLIITNRKPYFWKKIKSFFSDKGLQTNNIILKDKNRLVTDSSIIANTFNNYFINITNTLNLKPFTPKSKSLFDLLKLYEDHFSVLKIKEKYKMQNKFSSERFPQMK